MGCLANSTAICLFLKSRKVVDGDDDEVAVDDNDDNDDDGDDVMLLTMVMMIIMVMLMMMIMMRMIMRMIMMMMLIKMMLSVTDPLQLGVDEPVPHRAGDRRQRQHCPSYKLFLQVIFLGDTSQGQNQAQCNVVC